MTDDSVTSTTLICKYTITQLDYLDCSLSSLQQHNESRNLELQSIADRVMVEQKNILFQRDQSGIPFRLSSYDGNSMLSQNTVYLEICSLLVILIRANLLLGHSTTVFQQNILQNSDATSTQVLLDT